jgi:hypothetical protein
MAFTVAGSKVLQLMQLKAYIGFILTPAKCTNNMIWVRKKGKIIPVLNWSSTMP